MKIKFHSFLLASLAFFLLPLGIQAANEPLKEARQLISDEYVDQVPDSVLAKPTITAILEELDPYSVYMSSEEFAQFMNGIEQKIVGVGVVLEEHERGLQIISVVPGAPADRAGILAGDIITHADGEALAGKSVQAAIPLISGRANTLVTLTLERPSASPFKKTLKRQEIQLPTVEQTLLGGKVGYIRLHSFSADSAKSIQKAIKQLPEARSWILDLRDNGGGYVDAAQEVMGLFPNMKQAFQLKFRNDTEIYPVIAQPVQFKAPTALLVNAYSASASEMVAATVKERKAAQLYGQTTYGKGTMQTMFQFSDQSVLKLTIARFFTPAGTTIDQVGVKPNIVTEEGEELEAAHRGLLIQTWKGYKQLPALHNVPATKTFDVEMNVPMRWNSPLPQDAIQLIQLGGKEQPVTMKVKNERTITVTPKQPLQSGASYIFVVHPKWKNVKGKPMTRGTYLDVTVK